jgi:hypothetical protein
MLLPAPLRPARPGGPLFRWAWLAAALLLGTLGPAAGQVQLAHTARVDTSQANTKAVFQLLGNYFNARPDSLYANPYWNAAEVDYYFTQRHEAFDLGVPFLFFDLNARQTFVTYRPTVLSIEPAGGKYVARVLLHADRPPQWVTDSHWNPPFILRYYAAQDPGGRWQLENAWANELAKWQQFDTPWIRFHFPRTLAFSPARAQRASAFCDSVVARLGLAAARPFDYYVMDSEEELGRLFNFDYWLAYQTGFTRKTVNRTFSARGREQHLHEFVHMLYHPVANYFLAEGIATYLGGVDGYTPYQATLKALAADLTQHHPAVTFQDLYANKFKYPTNSNPRYAAGALVYELVQAKAGVAGFQQLEGSDNTYASLISHLAPLLHLRPDKVDSYLINCVKHYPARK